MPRMEISPLAPEHWAAVRDIYREGIAGGHATFEESCPDWAEWDATHVAACRFVALEGGRVVGWAALAPVSERCAYGGVAEVSVYVARAAQGRGVGRALLEALVRSQSAKRPTLNVLGLQGLGKEIWRDVDVQRHIKQERDSWGG